MEDKYGHEFCDGEIEEETIGGLMTKIVDGAKELQELIDTPVLQVRHPDDNERHMKHVYDAKHGL